MKKLLVTHIFPWLFLAAGIAGAALSRLLYTDGTDGKQLLISGHPAGTLLLLLSGAVLVFLAFAAWNMPRSAAYEKLFPQSVSRGVGCCIGAIGIAYSCIQQLSSMDTLSVLVLIAGMAAAICLLLTGTQRFFGMHPHYLFFVVLTVYLMVLGLAQCRHWGTQTQALRYLFRLLALLFLILSSYHHTILAAYGKNLRSYLFCSNAALFFCCVAFPADFSLFYLTAALWLVLDTRPIQLMKKECP